MIVCSLGANSGGISAGGILHISAKLQGVFAKRDVD